MEKVSIIIPVYNSEKYIKRCIDSILNQTYKNLEIILINDGSVDKSIDILNLYKKENENIIVIDKKNEGVSISRNLGIEMATGKYIMFMDNDDYIEENYIGEYVNNISDNDILIGGYERVNDIKVLFGYIPKNYEWSKYIIMAPWAKLYKTSFLKQNKIQFLDYPIGEDVYFNIKAFSFNPKIGFINNLGYKWYFNNESVSNTSQRGLKEDIDIFFLLDKLYEIGEKDDELLKYYFRRYCIWYLLFSGRYASQQRLIEKEKQIENWFKAKKINKFISPLSHKIKGENLKNRIIVLIFLIIKRLKLLKLFAKIYCGKELK